MKLEERIKQEIFLETIGSEPRMFLRQILGELLTNQPCRNEKAFVEKLIRNNENQVKKMRHKQFEEKDIARIERETEVLKRLLD